MAFDPDEFLKSSEPQPSAFDPDKFLQDTAPKPDPTVDRLETLHNTSSDTPENAARFKQLADSSGVTYEVAKAIPDKIEADSKRVDWKAFTSEAPKVAKHLAADPVAFDIAKYDIGVLKKIEQSRRPAPTSMDVLESHADTLGDKTRQWMTGLFMAGDSGVANMMGNKNANGWYYRQNQDDIEGRIAAISSEKDPAKQLQMAQEYGLDEVPRYVNKERSVNDRALRAAITDKLSTQTFEALPTQADRVARRDVLTDQVKYQAEKIAEKSVRTQAYTAPWVVDNALTFMEQMGFGLAGSAVAGPVGGAVAFGAPVFGSSYAENKAEGASDQTAAINATTDTAIETVTEMFGAKSIKEVAGGLIPIVEGIGKAMGENFAQEMLAQTAHQVADGLMKEEFVQVPDYIEKLDIPVFAKQVLANIDDQFQAGSAGLVGGGVMASGGAAYNNAIKPVSEKIKARFTATQQAERSVASVNAELSAIGESKLLQTSPKTLHQLMDVMDGDEKQDLYIDPTELFQGGVSKDAFLQAVPGAAQEIADAEVNGGVIKVSRNELLVGIKAANNPEMEAEVVRHIKVDAKGRSMAELEAEQGNLSNELQDLADKAVSQFAEESKGNQDLQDLLATIKEDLKAAGTPEGNEYRAMLWASLANAQGKASGQSAMDVYKQQFRGKVSNESLGGDVFNQQNPFTPENGFETVEEIDFSLPEGFTSLDDGSNVKPSASENGGADGKQPELDEFGDRRTNPDDKDIQLSNFPKARGWRVYDKAQLLEGIRLASDKIRGELGRTGSSESQATRELTSGPLGPFTSSSVSSEIKGDRLFIYYVGQEQAELGLTDEAALTVILNKTGELVVNGPPADSATFEEFKKLGWADFAEMKGGEKSDYWTSLTGFEGLDGAKGLLNPGTAAMLADAHARLRAWRGEDKVLINWVRYTGATGNALKGRKGVAFFQNGSKPWYKSALSEAATNLKQEKGTPEQMMAILSKTPGVKPAELEATGLPEYLQMQGKSVTKQQIIDYLAGNGVQVQETMLGDSVDASLPEGWTVQYETEAGEYVVRDEDGEEISSDTTREDAIRGAMDTDVVAESDSPKFGQYVLPGGKNYRELLLTLPQSSVLPNGWEIKHFPYANQYALYNERGEQVTRRPTKEQLLEIAGKSNGANFKSSHYDQPNILAHVRFNERTDADGKRVLFIEEIQSDWAQAGRKSGFQRAVDDSATDPAFGSNVTIASRLQQAKEIEEALPALRAKALQFIQDTYKELGVDVGSNDRAASVIADETKWRSFQENFVSDKESPIAKYISEVNAAALWRREAESIRSQRMKEQNRLPTSAPFVTSTDAWVGLSMKRMIAYAAQNGFDRIAWTTGEQQADRYDLSKQVDSVKVFHDANGTYEVRAIKDGEIISSQTNMEESKLESVVGKDLAQKIINEEGEQDKKTGFYTYKGDDLKVGGEGMKSFYDQIVPKVAKEITKKMGGKLTAVQIVGAYNEDIRISSFPDGTAMVEGQGQDKEFDTVAEAEAYRNELMGAQQQPGFDITPEMRSAVESGLPLFQNNEKAKGAFNPSTRDIALFAQADLSTFLHETGHLFLEIQMEMAAAENASERMVKDADNVLKWFGIKGETAEDRRAAWSAMSVDQQRQYHEKYAESFEQYLFEGKAPSVELRDSFRTFRQWLTHVYKSISKFLLGHDGAKLNDEVRGIFDRMLATEEQIKQAEESSGLYQFFTEKPEGLSQGEWDNYLRAVDEATQSAVDQLQSRSIRDLKWATGAQNKALKALQRQAKSERRIAHMDARKVVLSRPEYRAWQFLTAPVEGVEASNKKAKASAEVEPHRDSLFTAIAKLGGLNKDQAVSQYGIDPKDFHNRKGSIVGKPVLRATGGLSPDAMAEALSQFGYMKLDDNGKWDILDLDDMLRNEAAGDLVYSQNADYDLLLGKPVIAPNAEDVDFMGGRISRQAIRELYDDADLQEMQGEQVDTAGKLTQRLIDTKSKEQRGKWEIVDYIERKIKQQYIDSNGNERTKTVGDWNNAEVSSGSGQRIVNVFYLKNKDTGEVLPFGSDTAYSALGLRDSAQAQKEAELFVSQNDAQIKEDDAVAKTAEKNASDNKGDAFKSRYKIDPNTSPLNGYSGLVALEKDGKWFVAINDKQAERLIRRGWKSESLQSIDTSPTAFMQKGGMDIQAPISMMQSDSSGLLFQPAYHGTPYKFDKFSLEHMGKGEGAQAYGWGLYFAGNKDVAEYYRQALTQTYGLLDSSGNPVKMVTQDESAALAFVQANGHDFDKGIADLKEVAKTKPHFAAAVPIVERWKADGFGFGFKAGKEGQLYKVEIPEDDTYLLWDRPLSEQPQFIQDALAKHDPDSYAKDGNDYDEMEHGQSIYKRLEDHFAKNLDSRKSGLYSLEEADEAASKYLHSLGINGIKYLDGSSRGKGEGDYNYVIFDDNAVQILETFYQKGGKDKGSNKLDQFLSDDGLHPDVVADLFGFSSGDELIKKLARAPDPVSEIERLTDQFMVERHADLASPEAMQEAALDAVHNKARARMVATELAILQKAMGSQRMLVKQAKAYADRIVGKTTVRDLKPARYEASEAKAAKEAVKLQAQGKTKEAAIQLRNRVLHNATATAVRDANTDVEKARKFFAKIALASNEKNVKRGRDADVVNAINAVLAQYGFSTKKEKTALEYLSIVEQYDPEMAGFLKPIVENAMMNAKNWQTMSFDEFMGMRDEIDSLWYMAKRSRQMEVDGKRLDLDEASAMLMERMQQIGIPQDMPGKTSAITPKESAMRSLQYAGALLRRVEQWAEAKDGKFGGAFLRLIFQPVKIAADSYRRDRAIYRKKFKDLVQSLPDMKRGTISAPELDYVFGNGDQKVGMAELLHAVLHTGNESNKRKLLLGGRPDSPWASLREDGTLDTGRWDAFMARAVREGLLTKAHFDFAQGIWDLLEETKPLAQKTHREVFGRYFDEVSADQFGIQFPNGEIVTYRGGYVPAQVDSRLVNDAAIRELVDSENQNMAYSFPATSKGFTKARVEYNRPLLLNISSLTQHMDKVLLFSHMEPAVRDVNRLLKRTDVSEPLSRIDPAAYSGMLLPWLNRAARQSVETPITGDGGMARLLTGIRNRSGMGLMFGNISNTLQQITGVSNALTKVKGSHLRRAVATYIASPREMAERVSASSDFMRNRMDNEIAAITEQMNLILLDPTLFEKSKEWTQKHAYFLQSAFDNVMSPIVWTGAYNQAVTEGMTEVDAGRFADGVVRQTQGTTLPEDVSRIETGPAYARVFTQFTNYFNMLANTNVTELQKTAQDVGLKKGAGRALGVFFYGVLAPAWIAEAISLSLRGGPEDDDDDGYLDDWLSQVIGMGTLKMLLAGVPFVGQFANAGIARFNGNPLDDRVSLSPAVSLLESGFGAPYSVYKAIVDDGDKRKAVRDVATLLTLATGLPFIAAARPVGYLAAVADDKVEPTNVLDFARGTVTGVASPQSK